MARMYKKNWEIGRKQFYCVEIFNSNHALESDTRHGHELDDERRVYDELCMLPLATQVQPIKATIGKQVNKWVVIMVLYKSDSMDSRQTTWLLGINI